MIKPSSSQLQALSRFERLVFQVADWVNQVLKYPFIYWNACFMYILIWFGLSRRLHVKGLDNIKDLQSSDSLIIASNHRTFFDFFVITWVNFDRTNLPRRIFFPVRSRFFYDNILGIFLNFIMGGFAMFPPLFREPNKKIFNKYAIDRLVYELNQGNATIGFHPEGTRNKSTDPYSFLPPRSGVGDVIRSAATAKTIPMFIIGMSNSYLTEVYRNLVAPSKYPIFVCYGKPLTFPETTLESQQISEKVMSSIVSLSEEHRQSVQTKENQPSTGNYGKS